MRDLKPHADGGYVSQTDAMQAWLKHHKPDDPFAIVQSGWNGRYHVIAKFAIDKWLKQGYKVVQFQKEN